MVNRVSACFIFLINVHMYILLSKAIVIEGVRGQKGVSLQEFVLVIFMQNDAILGNTFVTGLSQISSFFSFRHEVFSESK